MSKARDISNLFSASTDVATDAEVNSAIANHAASTTNRHYRSGNSSSRPGSPNVGDIYTNTETGFIEIYESTGWSVVGAAATAPSSVTATNQGSGRAFNNGQASVAFSAGTVPGKTYTVTSSPGSYTATGSSSPIVVTGLQSSTQYTYTVTATNNYGTSAASAASAAVTATTVPQAPTIGTATASNAQASVTFTANATGGSAITSYTATSSPGGFTGTSASSPITVSGLTNGTNYIFTVTASNANGTSAASAASNSVAPSAGDFVAIATTTLNSNTQTVTFSSIPQTYKHLVVRAYTKPTDVNLYLGQGSVRGYFNGSDSGYYQNRSYGNGRDAGAGTYCGQIYLNSFNTVEWWVQNYTSTTMTKQLQGVSSWVNQTNTSGGNGIFMVNTNPTTTTDAVSSITFTNSEGWSFASGSIFALYGLKE